MAAAPFSLLSLLALLVVGGGAGSPLGMPPLPPDPVLVRVAPEKCFAYASWAGTATPDPRSKNETEQFLAEPEVQSLLAQIERVVVRSAENGAPPQQAAAVRDAVRWGKKLLMRPTAVFLTSFLLGPNGNPAIHGGLIVNAGNDAAELQAALEKYQALLPAAAEKVEIRGVACYSIKLAPTVVVTWGMKGNYLLVGLDGPADDASSFEEMLQRFDGKPPAWLAKLMEQVRVERPSSILYVNAKLIRILAAAVNGPQVRDAIQALGLDNVDTLAVVNGLEGEGFVGRSLIGIEGEPAGILSFAAAAPLAAKELAAIPRDANLALAARIDLGRTIDALLAIAKKLEPRGADEFERALVPLNGRLGIDLRKDVIESLGDTWCFYDSPGEGGLFVTGLTAIVPVKDHDRLAAAQEKLLALAKRALANQAGPARERGRYAPPPPRIEQLRFAGEDIYFVTGGEMPIAPAWCLTRDRLIVSAFPQQIKAFLSRRSDFHSLAESPEVAAAFENGQHPLAIWYFDPRGLLEYLYPMICVGLQSADRELAREGIDFSVAIVPSAPTIYRHLRPTVTTVRRTAAGVMVESRGTVPGTSVGSAAQFAFAFLTPAILSARQAGRRSQSANNLKQIGLGVLAYNEAQGHLPPAYIADKKTGKPLLSWRVAILPYIEQNDLYQQFHLDEPWDSPHNKRLSETPIAVYHPAASNAKPWMTNYLTLRGKDTLFPGKDGITAADIVARLANTILVAEVNDSRAVPWAKPDDLEYDESRPAAGLGGLFPGGFNAAFCDGSVRFVSDVTDSAALRGLINRHGAETAAPAK